MLKLRVIDGSLVARAPLFPFWRGVFVARVAIRRDAAGFMRDAFTMFAALTTLAVTVRRTRPVGVGGENEGGDEKG